MNTNTSVHNARFKQTLSSKSLGTLQNGHELLGRGQKNTHTHTHHLWTDKHLNGTTTAMWKAKTTLKRRTDNSATEPNRQNETTYNTDRLFCG